MSPYIIVSLGCVAVVVGFVLWFRWRMRRSDQQQTFDLSKADEEQFLCSQRGNPAPAEPLVAKQRRRKREVPLAKIPRSKK